MTRVRIGLFTHSTNPRGGVVHALELGDALSRAGHEVSVIAPAAGARPFFRGGPARRIVVKVPSASDGDLAADVARRIDHLDAFLADDRAPAFDVWHAHDPISANALARRRAFVRTVHHVDRHDDPRLDRWQGHGIRAARRVYCVSALWRDRLRSGWGIDAAVVGNGVDTARFTPIRSPRDDDLARRLGRAGRTGPVFLLVGGIERRKNTRAVLGAFDRVRGAFGTGAALVIAGGASLLDHAEERDAFQHALAALRLAPQVVVAGTIADDDMPSLYRLAHAVLSPSRAEGFGLCAIEAAACGVPAVVSAIAPFTEHLDADDCVWVDPDDVASIAAGMRDAVSASTHARLARSGPTIAARFGWNDVVRRQLAAYRTVAPCITSEERCLA